MNHLRDVALPGIGKVVAGLVVLGDRSVSLAANHPPANYSTATMP